MCGIAGIIAFQDNNYVTQIGDMTNEIRHRGPDDEGFVMINSGNVEIAGGDDTPDSVYKSGHNYSPEKHYKDANGAFEIALGHRRLSIIDLSPAGHQPMCDDSKSVWVVYNGEIYNFIELRAELSGKGHVFHSDSDTEVLINAYLEWGYECLHHFNGMFAFLLYDGKKNFLFAARDRYGIKPLYYYQTGDYIAFASEIKQFTVLPGWEAQLNRQRAYDFLANGLLDHTNETLFKNVYQLRGGEYIYKKIDDYKNKVTAETWYDLNRTKDHHGFQAAVNRFGELFKDSVNLRLRSDVAVGSCLSGGLDSSSIVCVARQILSEKGAGENQKTFSACSDDSRFDERPYIEQVHANTGVKSHYVFPTVDMLFDDNRTMTWHMDEPFSTTSIFAQWNVFSLASQHGVKVMLDGQGADEQLAGYKSSFFPVRLYFLASRFAFFSLLKELKYFQEIHGISYKNSLISLAKFILKEKIPNRLVMALRKKKKSDEWISLTDIRTDRYQTPRKINSVHAMTYNQNRYTILPRLLHWEDRNSMAHSIEARVPFLDYRLVDYLYNQPDSYKLSKGITKKILRESMKGVLPEGVRNRMEKLGFALPEEDWIKMHGKEKFREQFHLAVGASKGVIKESVLADFDKFVDSNIKSDLPVWRIISFGIWMDLFHVKN